jgi:membrane-associated PAP2 superfamily phosphatase
MRPFPDKTDSPSNPVSEAPAAPQGADCAWAALFGGGEIRSEALMVSRAGGKARGNCGPAAAAARY